MGAFVLLLARILVVGALALVAPAAVALVVGCCIRAMYELDDPGEEPSILDGVDGTDGDFE